MQTKTDSTSASPATTGQNPVTHLTLHENGEYSVIHQGMPVTKPQSLSMCQAYLKRAFPKLAAIATWVATEGRFA